MYFIKESSPVIVLFFGYSGVLLTYWWLIRFEKNNNRLTMGAIIYHFAHKYWRQVPLQHFRCHLTSILLIV
jgi:hypothetical protein